MTELFAGVDLGGTAVKCALADAEGNIAQESEVPTESHEGPRAVLARIAAVVDDLSSKAGAAPRALGMGAPGIVDYQAGVTRFLPNMPTKWRDVPVADILSQHLSCEVRLLNDVRTATLGELTFGHGKSAGTMVFFALGTGVGGGIVVDGKLRLGPIGAAGELGHQTIVPDGPLCGCGNHGCLETLVSGPALAAEGVRLLLAGLAPKLHDLVDGDAGRVTTKEMAEAAAAGDEAVQDAIWRAADYLGIGIANVIVTLHPDLIVLGGGVSKMGPVLMDRVRSSVQNRVRMFSLDDVRLEQSVLGAKAGLLGAVALASRGLPG